MERLEPLLQFDGYVCSLPSLRTKIRFYVDHPLLLVYMKFMTMPADDDDMGEASSLEERSDDSASVRENGETLSLSSSLERAEGFLARFGMAVVFCC